MQLSKRGMFRDCGPTGVFRHTDDATISLPTPNEVVVRIDAPRAEGPSYHYYLRATPKDVLRLLFTLSPDTIPGAIEELREEFELADVIPEVHRQLSIGSFALNSAPIGVEALASEGE